VVASPSPLPISFVVKYGSKIFDPYFTTKQKGSGLGLASAYTVVNKHGGYIEVSSQVGVGTTFHLYLPASEKDAVVEKKAAEEYPALAEGRVLVMDDEVIVRNVAYAILTSLGYKVTTATDGNEAIRLYNEAKEEGAPFDVVIMDLTVPRGMGGKEAVKRLLEFDPSAKVIVSSGYSNSPVMADFKKYGFSNIIAKPYMVNELGAKVHEVLAAAAE
jgi:CheY-like chemotaxis protein